MSGRAAVAGTVWITQRVEAADLSEADVTGVVSTEFYEEDTPGDRTVAHGIPALDMRAIESLALEVRCTLRRWPAQRAVLLALFRAAMEDA